MSWPVQVFTGPEYWLLQTWIIYGFIWWSTPCHLVPFNGTKHRSCDPFRRWTNLGTSTDLRMGIDHWSCSQVVLSITSSVIDLLFIGKWVSSDFEFDVCSPGSRLCRSTSIFCLCFSDPRVREGVIPLPAGWNLFLTFVTEFESLHY